MTESNSVTMSNQPVVHYFRDAVRGQKVKVNGHVGTVCKFSKDNSRVQVEINGAGNRVISWHKATDPMELVDMPAAGGIFVNDGEAVHNSTTNETLSLDELRQRRAINDAAGVDRARLDDNPLTTLPRLIAELRARIQQLESQLVERGQELEQESRASRLKTIEIAELRRVNNELFDDLDKTKRQQFAALYGERHIRAEFRPNIYQHDYETMRNDGWQPVNISWNGNGCVNVVFERETSAPAQGDKPGAAAEIPVEMSAEMISTAGGQRVPLITPVGPTTIIIPAKNSATPIADAVREHGADAVNDAFDEAAKQAGIEAYRRRMIEHTQNFPRRPLIANTNP